MNQAQQKTPGIEPVKTMTFRVSDESGSYVVEADSARSAAERFVKDGYYGDTRGTVWVDVAVAPSKPLLVEYYDAQAKLIGKVTLTDTTAEDFEPWDKKLVDPDEVYPRPDGWLGDWTNDIVATHVLIIPEIHPQKITVAIGPAEPECKNDGEHDWQSPYELLGWLKDNPGVFGHGGGVIYTEVCAKCGRYRITDTWAQRRDTGEQGLHTVEYRDADDRSRAWIESQRD